MDNTVERDRDIDRVLRCAHRGSFRFGLRAVYWLSPFSILSFSSGGWWLVTHTAGSKLVDLRGCHYCIPIVSGDSAPGRPDAAVLATRLKTGG